MARLWPVEGPGARGRGLCKPLRVGSGESGHLRSTPGLRCPRTPQPRRPAPQHTFTLAGFQNKTTVCDQAWQAWTTKTRCCSVSLRYPRGRGAQTPGTATDTGTAGKQKDIKTETRAPADRGLRSKHGVEAGAQTGMDTETLCAAGEADSRTQKDIETETDHGSKRGEEAGAQTGIRLSGTKRDIERRTGAGAGTGAETGIDTETAVAI